MLKRFGVLALMVSAAGAVFTPATAFAQDGYGYGGRGQVYQDRHDRDRERNERRERERREHERRSEGWYYR